MTPVHALSALLVGWFSITAIMAQPGTLDPDYADAGIAILQPGFLNDHGYEVVVLPDGKALICGTANVAGGTSAFICRLLNDGTVDTSFGPDSGYHMIDLGAETYFYDMKACVDGSIFVCGLSYVTYPTPMVILVKFDAQGALDPDFGTGGIASEQFGTELAEAKALSVLEDGRIVLAGRAGNGETSDALIMRYNADGTLDTTFNGQGWLTTTQFSGSDNVFQAMDVLTDGSIVAAGHLDQDFMYKEMIAKATPDGTWDTSFDGDGALVPDYTPESAVAYALLAQGTEFFVGGYLYLPENNRKFFVAKFDASGSPVMSFGTDGLSVVDNDVNDMVLDLAIQNDGKVLACGSTGQFGYMARDFVLFRLNADGSPDTGFGNNGITITSIGPLFDDANGMDIQPDGNILLTGMSAGTTNDLVIARYLGDGSTGITGATIPPTSIGVYPNPTTERIGIGDGSPLEDVRVLNAAGRIVLRSSRTTGGLNVSSLPTGLYQVIAVANGVPVKATFIKY